jgi:isoleucyl-tRNA synthetase
MSDKRFKPISTPDRIPQAEKGIVQFWDRNKIFEKSVSSRPEANRFVFYEGPPTANGKPGVHHVIARLCKDLVCRYKTMQGYRVIRKAGWDTHGLPVEIEVENQLGIKHKEEIEAYGIAEFNKKCRESVFQYEREWVEFTKRIGFWLDMDHPYITCENPYIETVWWIIKEIWRKGYLYEGHKIVPYCPRCETSLSSHEVSQGYKDVSDPSIFIKFKSRGADESFLVWTTTPWTLTSNAALAVGEHYDYVRVLHKGETLVLAEARLAVLEGDYEVLEKVKGGTLAGTQYEPLFDFYQGTEGAFTVHTGDFVSLEDGTGIVHIAPAFGEDDYMMHLDRGVPILQPVQSNGTFSDVVKPWQGQWIKDADPSIIKDLKQRDLLYASAKVTHAYPFCWRCSTALIYYARRSWYIKTTAFKDQLIEANKKVNWIPREVGEYRFGNWLENNVDWALSRERYWGTPLNIWKCDDCTEQLAVGSIDQLEELCTNFPGRDALDLHRPDVDVLELACPKCTGKMHRVSEVIDVWFDSGSMPFAQYHYPFENDGTFEEQFPAEFISEGTDQSRGWFYSLLAISTFLKGESSYKNVLTTEMILDKHGHKMSKSRGNTVDPQDLISKEGADALRWYLSTTSPPWLPTRFDRKGVVESSQKLLGTLRNVYSFFAMYAEVDVYRLNGDPGQPNLLDRWILSRFHTLTGRVREYLDAYDVTRAARLLQSFVLDELSNWYIRRSRRRFWKGEMGPDKLAAYRTLYTVLTGVLRLLAPFVPFVTEEIYQALRAAFTGDAGLAESVHLTDFPEPDMSAVDEELESLMETAMQVSALGRTVRNDAGIKIRQPLRKIIVHDQTGRAAALAAHEEIKELVLDELHVKELVVAEEIRSLASFKPIPSYRVLGKRFGKRVQDIVTQINNMTQDDLEAFWKSGAVSLDMGDELKVSLEKDDVSLILEGRSGYGAKEEHGTSVVLDLKLDDSLKMEGLAREIVNRLQNLRKKSGYDVTDRIMIRYEGEGAKAVFEDQESFINSETLATSAGEGAPEGSEKGWEPAKELETDMGLIRLWIRRETR